VRVEQDLHPTQDAALPQSLPFLVIEGWGNNVTSDLERSSHAAEPGLAAFDLRRAYDQSDRLSATRDQNGPAGTLNPIQDREAPGLELRYRNRLG
jgi:hypothetical protein